MSGISLKSELYNDDDLDQAAEYLRLAIGKLARHKTAVTPINYGLAYNYVAGKDSQLIEKLDKLLDGNKPLDAEDAESLFIRSFYKDDIVNSELRAELLSTVAQVLGSLVDIAGKTKLSNKSLEIHIQNLAKASDTPAVLAVVNHILEEAREFVTTAKHFETDINRSAEDVSKLKKELINARKEAKTDALTQLNNRRSFNQELGNLIEIHDKNSTDFSIILVDIDHFKKVNDDHGHLVGDKVLSSLAKILTCKVRGSDFTARYGGEEFAILLPNTRITNAFSVAENIRMTIEKNKLKLRKSGASLGSITASFGIAGHRAGEDADDFLERCDNALYRAKELGRNRCVLAD